jgi:hypothetical protein
MAAEVRDSLEIAHTSEYLNFLKCYFRAFSVILNQLTTPQFVETPEHKLRHIVVEILNRLPHSEVLRPFVLVIRFAAAIIYFNLLYVFAEMLEKEDNSMYIMCK